MLWLLGGLGFALGLATWFGVWCTHWGATEEEVRAAMVGDEWGGDEAMRRLRMTRAISLAAAPETVWPWLAQMGRGAGWYSHDLIDNFGRRSARHLVSWIPDPAVGDASAIGYVRAVEPGSTVAWWLSGLRSLGTSFGGVMVWQVTAEGEQARLVMRMRFDARGWLARPALWGLRIGDGIMARRQLLNLKERVERFGVRDEDPENPEDGSRHQYQRHHAILARGEEAGLPGVGEAATFRRAALADGVLDLVD